MDFPSGEKWGKSSSPFGELSLTAVPPPTGTIQRSLAYAKTICVAEMSGVHLETTLGFLAKGLPVYDISFGRAGEVRIEHAGDVG